MKKDIDKMQDAIKLLEDAYNAQDLIAIRNWLKLIRALNGIMLDDIETDIQAEDGNHSITYKNQTK